jgi:serine/threonine protein kinase
MEKRGKWESIKELGEGGQGKVYLSRDTTIAGDREQRLADIKQSIAGLAGAQHYETQRKTAEALVDAISLLSPNTVDASSLGALKVLHKPKQENGYDKALERMRQEVTILKQLQHPNILKILDHSIEERWFVGEYHANQTLWDHKERFKGDMLGALTAFKPLVEGVVELHKANRVHRDIKPHNVFIAADGRLVLGDFGIVFFDDPDHTRVTNTYENVGSRDWMPMWAAGMRIEDTRPTFDVFGLGKLLWAMLSGRSLLPLWYHHKRAYELEEMFPKEESIKWARIILDRCIVEDEDNCLSSASQLLELVDEVLHAVKRHGQVVGERIERRCRVCGQGRYELVINEDTTSLRNFGLSPAGVSTFKVFKCSRCGHVELFHFDDPKSKPMAWNKS